MARLATILISTAFALAFGLLVPLINVMKGVEHFMVAVTIMTAAVFVRLNRGMPTLDWKTLEIGERKRITSAIEGLTLQYVYIVGINAAVLCVAAVCAVYDDAYWLSFPPMMGQLLSAAWGFFLALAASRMAFVVWRDYDVVRLQKRLIDAAGDREETEKQAKRAADNVVGMQSAALRKVEVRPPRAWPES